MTHQHTRLFPCVRVQGVLSHAELSLNSVRKDLEQLQQARVRAQQETAAQVRLWVINHMQHLLAEPALSGSLARVVGES